ncbi:MAG: DUF1189 domain-containing protein [Oscillospiraceae bacterium]|nr:DUF1189 domain-containing protein [Oscillospiraceae bacterium]
MNDKKSLNFFKSAYYAIVDFEKYVELMYQKGSKAIKYFFIILLLFSLLISIAGVISIVKFVNGNMDYLQNEFPNFSFADNTLKVESDGPINLTGNNGMNALLIIDTNATEEQVKQYSDEAKVDSDAITIIVLSDKVIVSNLSNSDRALFNLGGLPTTEDNGNTIFKLSDLSAKIGLNSFTKQSVVDYLSSGSMAKIYLELYVFLTIYTFLMYIVGVFGDVIVIAIFAFITSRIYRIKLNFTSCMKISVYALTLPLILKVIYIWINTLTGFVVQYFDYAYITIAYIYVLIGILMIRNDKYLALNGPVKKQEEPEIQEQEFPEEEEKEEKKDEELDDKSKKKEKPKIPKPKVEPEPGKA